MRCLLTYLRSTCICCVDVPVVVLQAAGVTPAAVIEHLELPDNQKVGASLIKEVCSQNAWIRSQVFMYRLR